MTDVVDAETRSRMMSGIRGKDTQPEMLIRSMLHRAGFRYRLHHAGLPGKPDLVFPKYKALILINGCFWHGHDCHLFKWPSSRPEFWREKIEGNKARDVNNLRKCRDAGWRVMVIWECAMKGNGRVPAEELSTCIRDWLLGGNMFIEIAGNATAGS